MVFQKLVFPYADLHSALFCMGLLIPFTGHSLCLKYLPSLTRYETAWSFHFSNGEAGCFAKHRVTQIFYAMRN